MLLTTPGRAKSCGLFVSAFGVGEGAEVGDDDVDGVEFLAFDEDVASVSSADDGSGGCVAIDDVLVAGTVDADPAFVLHEGLEALIVLEFDAFHEGLGGPDDAIATGVARDADHARLDRGEGGVVVFEALEVLRRRAAHETIAVEDGAADDDVGILAGDIDIVLGSSAGGAKVSDEFFDLGLVPEESFRLGAFDQSCFFGDEIVDVCAFGVGRN